MNRWRKGLLVGLGAVALSTLGLQATDLMQGVESSLFGSLLETGGPCGTHAVPLLLGGRTLCVDQYEASPSEECSVGSIKSLVDTETNLTDGDCAAATEPGVEPWRFVSLTDAQQLCARSGKRLPTNEEWYKTVSGFGDQDQCVTDTDNDTPQPTGKAACVSPLGVYDLIGNVWEWIDEEVTDGQYRERSLPETGYVQSVDTDGIVVTTGNSANTNYGEDYAWTSDDGVRAIIRGGFYGSGDDAGIYSQNIAVPTDCRAAGVGFRCVKDI